MSYSHFTVLLLTLFETASCNHPHEAQWSVTSACPPTSLPLLLSPLFCRACIHPSQLQHPSHLSPGQCAHDTLNLACCPLGFTFRGMVLPVCLSGYSLSVENSQTPQHAQEQTDAHIQSIDTLTTAIMYGHHQCPVLALVSCSHWTSVASADSSPPHFDRPSSHCLHMVCGMFPSYFFSFFFGCGVLHCLFFL